MSKDRLEEAITAMKGESVHPEKLEEARARVWEKLGRQSKTACSEFQLQFQDYLDGRLDSRRRLLIDDHLSRCPHCRAQLAEQRGERKKRCPSRFPVLSIDRVNVFPSKVVATPRSSGLARSNH